MGVLVEVIPLGGITISWDVLNSSVYNWIHVLGRLSSQGLKPYSLIRTYDTSLNTNIEVPTSGTDLIGQGVHHSIHGSTIIRFILVHSLTFHSAIETVAKNANRM
jgi:hypothetical protein